MMFLVDHPNLPTGTLFLSAVRTRVLFEVEDNRLIIILINENSNSGQRGYACGDDPLPRFGKQAIPLPYIGVCLISHGNIFQFYSVSIILLGSKFYIKLWYLKYFLKIYYYCLSWVMYFLVKSMLWQFRPALDVYNLYFLGCVGVSWPLMCINRSVLAFLLHKLYGKTELRRMRHRFPSWLIWISLTCHCNKNCWYLIWLQQLLLLELFMKNGLCIDLFFLHFNIEILCILDPLDQFVPVSD